METIAAGDEVAFENFGFAVAQETHARTLGSHMLQYDLVDLRQHYGVPPACSLEQILLDFCLPIGPGLLTLSTGDAVSRVCWPGSFWYFPTYLSMSPRPEQ